MIDERLLETYRWRPQQLSAANAIWIAPTSHLREESISELAPDDPSGARGLLIAAMCLRFRAEPQMLEFHRPRPTAGLLRPPHPSFVIIRDQNGRRTRNRRIWTSVSRSEGLVAVGASTRRVGIDVEKLQDPAQCEILMTLMHPQDQALARSRIGLERQYIVTALWSRIEAIVKLRGTGLRTDPATLRAGATGRSQLARRKSIITACCDELGRPTSSSTTSTVHRDTPIPEYVVSAAYK